MIRICTIAILLTTGQAAADDHFIYPVGEGPYSWDSYEAFAEAHDFSGQSMTLTGPGTGDDKTRMENMLAYFEAATGASVSYSGSESFEQDIVIGIEANSAPNVAIFPQPGLVRDLARKGALAPLDAGTAEFVRENYAAGQSWVDLATFEGPEGEALYGMFYQTDVKSLVWYVPAAFDESGYDVPETMEELKELTELIVEEGGTPWCLGLGSGAATGWPATDWVEDLMLRTVEPEVYDQWVSNEIPFDDPRVVAAIEEFGFFALEDEFVAGGSSAVPNTDFRDSPNGLFAIPPDCYMHRQASFIPNYFPDGTEMGLDADFFYFPAYASNDLGSPVLGSGGLIAITDDSPVARGFFEWLKTPIAHEIFMTQGNFLTAFKGANPDAYPSDSQRALGEILTDATTFRFDGSDLMPGEVGTSAFWSGMVDYVTGTPAEEVAGDIQRRWDQTK